VKATSRRRSPQRTPILDSMTFYPRYGAWNHVSLPWRSRRRGSDGIWLGISDGSSICIGANLTQDGGITTSSFGRVRPAVCIWIWSLPERLTLILMMKQPNNLLRILLKSCAPICVTCTVTMLTDLHLLILIHRPKRNSPGT